MKNARILVTGGLGFIGSHACISLLEAGCDVVAVDNLSNSEASVRDRIQRITGCDLKFFKCNLENAAQLRQIFDEVKPNFVMHLAGLKSVAESVERPLEYYKTNVLGTLNVLDAMTHSGCSALVFSSSATVYGVPEYLPCDETHPTEPTNPYGRSKLICESIISDWVAARDQRSSVILRYFNPVGAHNSGLLGESPQQAANNLMPILLDVVSGRRAKLEIFGNDYETIDGTGVRDFIHVMDLAEAHLSAINYLNKHAGVSTFNLGSGSGTSVLQLVEVFEQASGISIDTVFSSRRPGDLGEVWTNTALARTCLEFVPQRSVYEMCKDAYNFSVAKHS